MTREALFAWIAENYGAQPQYKWARSPESAVLQHAGGKWFAVVMPVAGKKLGLAREEIIDVVNVKCDTRMSGVLREEPGILPAYHMNKEHWVSVLLDGTVPDALVRQLIDDSYLMTLPKPKGRRAKG